VLEFPPPFDVEMDGQVLTVDLASVLTAEEFAVREAGDDPAAAIALGLHRTALAAGIAVTYLEVYAAVVDAFVDIWSAVTADG
jgi:hypothetical protein